MRQEDAGTRECLRGRQTGRAVALLAALVSIGVASCTAPRPGEPKPVPEPQGDVTAKNFCRRDTVFRQLDRNGSATSITHFFRELRPQGVGAFTIKRSANDEGEIVLYRLRNVGTGEMFDFPSVPVERLPSSVWQITEGGWTQIRENLEARMKVQLRRIRRP